MKTLFRFLFCMAFIGLLFSCQKSDEFSGKLSGVDLKSASKGAVIIVEPSGLDDTDNLKQAFADAALAGPGTTIQLVEGEYFVGYMEIFNFQGSLVGAGKNKTVVTMKPPVSQQAQFIANLIPGWLRMIDGDINISDMTFKTPDGSLLPEDESDPWYGKDLFSMFVFNNYNDYWYNPEKSQKVKIQRVYLESGYDNPEDGTAFQTDHNVLLGIWVGADYWWPLEGVDYPLTKGNFVIDDCEFEHFIDAAEGFGLGEDAEMELSSCRFNNCYWPLYFTANYNSKISVLNNTFSNTTGVGEIVIEDSDWGVLINTIIEPLSYCRYNIIGNTFYTEIPIPVITTKDYWAAIGPEERLPMLFNIQNNVFNLVEGCTGIVAMNSQNAIIKNNKLRGNCATGIQVDGVVITDWDGNPIGDQEVSAKNVLMQGNNFSNLNSSFANIWLGQKSMNCTVVGSRTDGNVIDEGLNNKITGMQKEKPGLKIGPTITDNLRLIRKPK